MKEDGRHTHTHTHIDSGRVVEELAAVEIFNVSPADTSNLPWMNMGARI